ncbi:hypothetical protein ACIQW7_14525 [Peribacillus simplex]|uniref:hypothetical protein n=1 Tax=Peribacillus simplex TaxID=1478 RepID=UPI00381BF6C1
MEEKVEKQPHDLAAPVAFMPECLSKALILLVMKAICLLWKSLEPNILYCFLCAISHKWQR